MNRPLGRLVVLGTFTFAALCPAGSWAAGAKEYSYLGGADGKRLYDHQFFKWVTDKLGTTYDNLQIVVTGCRVGGFAEEASVLGGKVSVAVCRSKKYDHGVPPFNTDNEKPKVGGKALKSADGEKNVFGWHAQWIRKLRDDGNATADDLFKAAKDNDNDDDAAARASASHVFKNGGDAVKIILGKDKNQAMIWWNQTSAGEQVVQLFRTIRDQGYDDKTKKNARIDFAYGVSDDSDVLSPSKNDHVYSDRKAEAANVPAMLDNLKNNLAEDKKGFIWLGAHGNVGVFKESLAPAPQDASPKGLAGHVVSPGNPSETIDMTANLLADFYVGVVPDTSRMARALPAAVEFYTSQESYSGPLGVYLEGRFLGTVSMLGSSAGGAYQIDIPDAVVTSLHASNDLGIDSLAVITFAFSGGGSPSFTLATLSDFDSGLTPFYGVGLVGPSLDSGVPMSYDPPAVVESFATAADKYRLVVDRSVTAASATNPGNYRIGSLGGPPAAAVPVDSTLIDLTVPGTGLSPGAFDTVSVHGLVAASTGVTMNETKTAIFHVGILRPDSIQTPARDSLMATPCRDVPRFGSGGVVTTEGICTAAFGATCFFEGAATLRDAIVVYRPMSPLSPGHKNLLVGSPQDFAGQTEFSSPIYVLDEGTAPIPPPVTVTVGVVAKDTCDVQQNRPSGQDYEGMLVKLSNVRCVTTGPSGASFVVTSSTTSAPGDSIEIEDFDEGSPSYTYTPNAAHILDVTGVVRCDAGPFRICPRSDSDIQLVGLVGAEGGPLDPRSMLDPIPMVRHGVIHYTIRLQTGKDVTLGLYDLAGRRVAELFRGRLEEGSHQLTWSGSGVQPGCYFVRVSNGARVQTRTVVLLQ
jgi:hypothetical protein